MIRFAADHRMGAGEGGFRLEARFESTAAVTALFGASGAGKTTAMRMIAGLIRPDRGRIEVDGQVLVDTERGVFLPPRRRRIGLVFQDALLFPHMSVRANLMFGRWFAPRDSRPVPFEPVVATLGIGSLLGRRPASLSGGERQRVAIGRALLSSPRLLLMDEPLAALDRPRKLEILPLIERLRDEFAIPIVYVSHAVEEVARLAGHVVVLDRGRIAGEGPPDRVFGLAATAGVDRFDLVSVLAGRVDAYEPAYGLTRIVHPAGTLWLPGPAGEPGRELAIVVRATDVTLAAEPPPARMSVRSVLAGTIAALHPTDQALARVEIALPGGGTLVASVTRMGLAALGLGPGDTVHALVKTVSLDERPMAGGTVPDAAPGSAGAAPG